MNTNPIEQFKQDNWEKAWEAQSACVKCGKPFTSFDEAKPIENPSKDPHLGQLKVCDHCYMKLWFEFKVWKDKGGFNQRNDTITISG